VSLDKEDDDICYLVPAFHDPCDAQDPERQDVGVDALGKQPNAKYTRREMAQRRPPCGRTAGSRQRPRCRALAGATEHELWRLRRCRRAVPRETGADGYYDTEGCCLDMVSLGCFVAADCFQASSSANSYLLRHYSINFKLGMHVE
jgi:hypothetical protein